MENRSNYNLELFRQKPLLSRSKCHWLMSHHSNSSSIWISFVDPKLAQIFFEWMQNYHANQGNSTGTQKLMVEPTQLILESPQLILNSPVNRNKVKYEAMYVVLTESFNKKCVFYITGILCILSWTP